MIVFVIWLALGAVPCKTDGLELVCGTDCRRRLVPRTHAGLPEAYERVHSQPNMSLELVYGADLIFIFIFTRVPLLGLMNVCQV
jgi:hypothetical protein